MSCRRHSNHVHHIVPQYAGGTNNPDNLVTISDTCHTMWHWCERQRIGIPQELGAYLLLRGQIEGESHSSKMRRLWANLEYREWMRECRQDYTEWAKDNGIYSVMGVKGGSINASQSSKVAMMNYLPYRQRQLCTQNNKELETLLDRWLTVEHKDGYKLTVKFDYSMKPITQKLSLFSGKTCSTGRWTSLFTKGVTVAGWTLTLVSI